MSKTVFLDIVNREVPASIVHEDDLTLAFLDQSPLTKGHTLVIPKEPIDHIDDCSPELYAAVFSTVQKVTTQLKKAFKPKRVALVVHGFEIPHAHVHVVPMYTGKEMRLAAIERQKCSDQELEEVARQINDA